MAQHGSLQHFKALIMAVFGLLAVYSLDTRATTACVLIHSQLTPPEQADWKARGYTLKHMPDFESLKNEEYAALLKKFHFGIYRKNNKNEFWFSLTEGKPVKNWKPLAMRAPKAGEKVSASYDCQLMQRRFVFFQESRKAVTDMIYVLSGKEINRTQGEMILDLERSFFVHKGQTEYESTKSKTRYLKVLSKAKALANSQHIDFFQAWQEVRKIVFDNNQEDINYCRDRTSMTEALAHSCTNCVGETYLLLALFKDAKFKAPAGWNLGTQMFKDHLRLVLYNISSKKTYDMATGRFENFRAAIFDIKPLYSGLWKGHSALRFENELSWVKNLKPNYVHKDYSCHLPFRELRPELRPSDLSGLSACDTFADGEVPEQADNQNKAEPPAENKSEGQAQGADQMPSEKREGQGFSVSAVWENLKSALSGKGDLWMGFKGDGSSSEEFKKGLRELADNLIPEERQALLASIEHGRFTPEAIQFFSISSVIEQMGFGYFKHLEKYQYIDDETRLNWNSVILPVKVEYVESLILGDPGSQSLPLKPQINAADIQIQSCLARMSICITSTDKEWVSRIQNLSAAQRFKEVAKLISHRVTLGAKMITQKLAQSAPNSDLIKALGEITDNSIFIQTSHNLALLQMWPSLNDMITAPNGESYYIQNIENNPIRDAIHKLTQVESIKNLDDWVRHISEYIQTKPVEILKQLDEMGPDKKQSLRNTVNGIEYLRFWLDEMHYYPQFKGWFKTKSVSSSRFFSNLLYQTLTHHQYFFTVEPEEDEILESRPYFPMKIQDPEVRDSRRKASSPQLPKIDLPRFNIKGVCNKDSKGIYSLTSKSGIGIAVECPSSDEDGPLKESEDRQDQSGIENGSDNPNSRFTGVKNGDSDLEVRMGIREMTLGSEKRGHLPLLRPLSDKEKRIQALEQMERIQQGGKDLGDMGLVDPRQEVHLKPETWKWLLSAPDGLLRNQVLSTPLVKLLLHHAYRKKLEAVFNDASLTQTGFRILTPADYGSELFSLNYRKFKEYLKQYRACKDDGACEMAVTQSAENAGIHNFEALGEEGFLNYVEVAKRELSHPKAGYLILTQEGVSQSLEQMWQIVKLGWLGSRTSSGMIAPYVFVSEGGREFAPLATNFGSDGLDFNAYLELPGQKTRLLSLLNSDERRLMEKYLSRTNGVGEIFKPSIESDEIYITDPESEHQKILGVMNLSFGGDPLEQVVIIVPTGNFAHQKVDTTFLLKVFESVTKRMEATPQVGL